MPGDRAAFSTFHDQFLLSARPLVPPPGWRQAAGAGWHLVAHPSLSVSRLRTAEGGSAGFALGLLIDRQGRLADGEIVLPPGSEERVEELERFLYSFGGRFTCILLLPGLERVYVDPLASLSTVWCPRRRRVASTPTLLLHDEPGHPLFRRGLGGFPGNRPNQFFPADLTAVAGISRLLPNHVLDLGTWSATRHHPSAPFRAAPEDEIPQLAATFHQVVRRQIGAVVEACGGGYLALTAGHDSRRLLACARDLVDRLECVTLRGMRAAGKVSNVDLDIAGRLAARFALRHRILPARRVPLAVAGDYVRRIGFAGGPGKAAKFFDPPCRFLDLDLGWMTGHGGGLCRALYLRRMPVEERPDGRRLLRLLRLDERPGFAEAMERWSAGLPEGPRELRLDLTMLENQGGGWVSPHLYGTAPFRINFFPLTHRDAIDAVLRVPAVLRAAGRFDAELFRLAWPELLALPFNQRGGLVGWADRVRARLSSVAGAARRRPTTPRRARARPRGDRAASDGTGQ